MNKTKINCRSVGEIENQQVVLKHGEMMLSPFTFMMHPIMNLINGPNHECDRREPNSPYFEIPHNYSTTTKYI